MMAYAAVAFTKIINKEKHMKTLIGILAFLGTLNAFAGTTDCHAPIDTARTVIELREQGLVSVSALLSDRGCSSTLTVQLKGLRQQHVDQISFLATRKENHFGMPLSVAVPFALDKAKFVRIGEDAIEIRNQLIVGDILFLSIPSVGVLPFSIQ